MGTRVRFPSELPDPVDCRLENPQECVSDERMPSLPPERKPLYGINFTLELDNFLEVVLLYTESFA